MCDDALTLERIDKLLAFLPQLEAPGRTYVQGWGGGERTPDGAITMPYPMYETDVVTFFLRAGQPWWSDFDYDPRTAQELLRDDAHIARCSLEEIKTLLTYCVRGERFVDGHWLHLLETGRVVAVLRRLAELRQALGEV
jgi:hypothetical protein